MGVADRRHYLADVVAELQKQHPESRVVNIVCHGHSIPTGYFQTPLVDTFSAYPHLLHRGLKDRFPFSVVNVIVTGAGGQNSERGAAVLGQDVLCHRPDVLTIQHGIGDRAIGLRRARRAWTAIIEQALSAGVRLLLVTPAANIVYRDGDPSEAQIEVEKHAQQTRDLASEHGVGLVDAMAAFRRYEEIWGDLSDLFSCGNHPSRTGHEIIARELLRWFPARMDIWTPREVADAGAPTQ